MLLNLVIPGRLSDMFFSFFLVAACAFRYNGLSFVYLIYLLLIPLFAEPTKTTMQGKMILHLSERGVDTVHAEAFVQ